MAITPLPGWRVDPNNPNAVIQDGPPINLGSTAFGAVNSPYPAQSSNIRDLQIRGGDPASIVQSSGTQAQGVAQGSAPQFDGNALIQLLQSYQKKALTQGFNAQQAQIAAGQQTPEELIGASPGLQSSVRSAQEASFNPTIQGANTVDVALRDQVSNIRQLLTQQQTMVDKSRDDARAVIKDAFTLGGADSMKDLDPTEIAALEKSAGYPKGYIAGLAQTMKERELQLRADMAAQADATRRALGGTLGGVKFTAAQKDDLATMGTLQKLSNELLSFYDKNGDLPGVGGLFAGSIGQFTAKQFGSGTAEEQQVRNMIGNIKATLAKLRGGTSFTVNEQKLLETYVPGINEEPLVILQKLRDLNHFIDLKRQQTYEASGGTAPDFPNTIDNDPLGIRSL